MKKLKSDQLMVVTLAIATMVSLFATIALQQAYALSKYDTSANDPNSSVDDTKGKIDQSLQQDDLDITAQPSPTTNCAMNTIESLESFLSCLGAK